MKTTFVELPDSAHPIGTGDGTRTNPLRLVRLTDHWDELGEDVRLGVGLFEAEEFVPKPMMRGMGADKTTIRNLNGSGVARGNASNTSTSRLRLIANRDGKKTNGWTPTGDHNCLKDVVLEGVFSSDGKYESFAVLPYGDHCKVINVTATHPVGDYCCMFLPYGENPFFYNCRAEGSGNTWVGFALYGKNAYLERCTYTGVRYGFYGDVGGHDPDRIGKVWGGNKYVHCGGTANERSIKVVALDGQVYSHYYFIGGEYVAPQYVGLSRRVKKENGSVTYDWPPMGEGWHWDDVVFKGEEGVFYIPNVEGCTAKALNLEVQPVAHPDHPTEFLHWDPNNSHSKPVPANA